MLQLNQIDTIPAGLLELQDITQLHTILPHPTLLHVKGKQAQPLFVSVLLHANEPTGFFAIQSLLKKYQEHPMPRDLIVFFGNISACREGLRRLPNQPDYNRVWPGGDYPESEETRLMQQVVDIVEPNKPFASIDIHNNTGKNPHYGCINKLANEFLHMASLFSRTVVYFESPKGVQSMAMAEFCPAITLECGKPDEPHGIEHAADYVDTLLHLESLSSKHISEHDVAVYQTVARVIMPDSTEFDFETVEKEAAQQDSQNNHDICFEANFDTLNFSDLHPGHVFGHVSANAKTIPITVIDDDNNNVTTHYFSITNNKLTLNKPVMPAMITLNKKVIRQDCLCYLMEPLEIYV